MRFSTLIGAASIIAAASAATPYRPGVPADPFPSSAANARVKVNADTACADGEDTSKPRNIQLASWVECSVLSLYPYPRSSTDPNNTDWTIGYEKTFHPTLRASFNGTRFNYDGFLNLYKSFSGIIGANYIEWQQWRDFYVASPDSWDAKSRGGVVTTQGFNGGVLRSSNNGQNVTNHSPNAGFFVVEEIEGRRWITEIREQSTLASAYQLPKDGQKWPCRGAYEVCG
ncbi:hypothetical protein CC80DRAFT_469526 [Byssothecium circinans]|uniref:Uncharacterized protein n=1 Tax=Byssothecium circinans TaxID=147558 RepID=A0A6A5U0T9_9PLEO|nr:hypothetical protein CC80DRAFT_469526 [Byssothecium circinans]